jgi:hypothetical protein
MGPEQHSDRETNPALYRKWASHADYLLHRGSSRWFHSMKFCDKHFRQPGRPFCRENRGVAEM